MGDKHTTTASEDTVHPLRNKKTVQTKTRPPKLGNHRREKRDQPPGKRTRNSSPKHVV